LAWLKKLRWRDFSGPDRLPDRAEEVMDNRFNDDEWRNWPHGLDGDQDPERLLDDHELADYGVDPPPDLFLDIPFVPTEDRVIRAMLDLAAVDGDDIVYDLGCGDGRIVVAAAMQRGARAVGIDLDPMRIAEAMEYAGNSRVEHMVDFREGNLLEADFSDATVVCLYLLDSVNLELRPRLQQELRPGTRIVSHAFGMGDWTPDAHVKCGNANIYMWIVPAQVAGSWEWHDEQGHLHELELEQDHQMLKGRIRVDGREARSFEARLEGDRLELEFQLPGSTTASVLRARHDGDELVFLQEPAGAS